MLRKRGDIIQIHPVHSSLKGFQRTPAKMARITVSRDTRESMTNVALSIFADCANHGIGFQDALLAIYISGLQHGSSIATGEAK